jgi:hypothetical protein
VSFNLAGALTGPFIIDATRRHFLDPTTHKLVKKTLPLLGDKPVSAYATIMAVGCVFALLSVLVLTTMRKDFEHRESVEPIKKTNPFIAFREVLRDRVFWRFIVLLLLLALVRMMFQHMHFTWPKYVLRFARRRFPRRHGVVGQRVLDSLPCAARHCAHPSATCLSGAPVRRVHLGAEPLRALFRIVDALPDRHDPGADGGRGAVVAAPLRVQRLDRAARA